MTTRFLQDIIRQRVEMQRTIDYLIGPGHAALEHASSLIRSARDVVITIPPSLAAHVRFDPPLRGDRALLLHQMPA